ncbi:hypothetical protein LCGC14_0984090 [marine sediment metagenome]|uniref:Uncharacterized protein n=1 Tax=marine sediment metagenome TaxID=412755 RepID=A0A0F9NU43_9ZZZZ
MIKVKRIKTGTLTSGVETLYDMLAGMSGKNRVIIAITTIPLTLQYLRVYRDADQIVDVNSLHLVAGSPWLKMDLPLAEGQQCKVGFYNDGALTTAKHITIIYTESE